MSFYTSIMLHNYSYKSIKRITRSLVYDNDFVILFASPLLNLADTARFELGGCTKASRSLEAPIL
jgi:hypothetical protein